MNLIINGFKEEEYGSCSGKCSYKVNYIKLCNTLNTKWNQGEKQRCPNLVCSRCVYCQDCRTRIYEYVKEINEHKKKISIAENTLKKEYGCEYEQVKDIKY